MCWYQAKGILKEGQSDHAIIKLEKPCCAFIDDRFIIRSYSSMKTLAGGMILEIKKNSSQQFHEFVCAEMTLEN